MAFKFICWGSGSSGNCYYLFTPEEGLLIDAGIGVRTLKKYFKDRDMSISKVKNILITHDHADHIKAVGILSDDYQLPVYATQLVHEGICRNYCIARKVPEENRRVLVPGVTVQVGPFSVTPFTVPHDSTDNVGYRVEYDGVVFCLMTDVGHVTDTMKQHIADADYLVIEANHDTEMLKSGPYPQHLKLRIASPTGHLSNADCARAIAENATARLKHAWLCHLSEENNHPELVRKTVESILRSYGVVAGVDFRLDVLKRKTPSITYDLVR